MFEISLTSIQYFFLIYIHSYMTLIPSDSLDLIISFCNLYIIKYMSYDHHLSSQQTSSIYQASQQIKVF